MIERERESEREREREKERERERGREREREGKIILSNKFNFERGKKLDQQYLCV
jgi:hypothetical protein